MEGKCVIFSAPSGAGKTTIVRQLLQRPDLKLEFSISATSRPLRGNEQDGNDYYFLTSEIFRNKISAGDFVEWEEVYTGTLYGTLKSELQRIWQQQRHVAFDVDVKGGLNLKKLFKENALAIFVKPPSLQELEQRLRNRGTETEEKIAQRLARAEFELSLAPQFDVQLINDVLERAVEEAYIKIKEFLNKSIINV
jgi:guanylate kinase